MYIQTISQTANKYTNMVWATFCKALYFTSGSNSPDKRLRLKQPHSSARWRVHITRYICMHVRCTNTTSTSKIVNHSKPIKHSLVSVISTWIHKHQLAATAIAKRDTRISDWWWDLLELKTLMHIRVRGEVDHLQHSICEHWCIMINDILFNTKEAGIVSTETVYF